ncbi:helix-turn-helix domain-containing protein [Sorangium sp. So ce542]|uniref:helix-turn-helix domain-containing protein n=1 Tax=Sorangium sp. So ce542 TaxID=3133316 RepID=UPI003F5FF017
MSQADLPVNLEGPGLTVVYGWSSEERRAKGLPASIQGIEFRTDAGKLLVFDHCPFCGGELAGSATSVRATVARRTASEGARTEQPPVKVERAPRDVRAIEVARPRPASAASAPPTSAPATSAAAREQAAREQAAREQAATGSTSLKVLREKLGLSQAELGGKLGLARSSVANYENGRSPLSQRLRKWIAKHEAKLTEGGNGAGRRGSAAA